MTRGTLLVIKEDRSWAEKRSWRTVLKGVCGEGHNNDHYRTRKMEKKRKRDEEGQGQKCTISHLKRGPTGSGPALTAVYSALRSIPASRR